MTQQTFRKWVRSLARPRNRRPIRKRHATRLNLEKFEERSLPSSSIPLNGFTWTSIGPSPIRDGQSPGAPSSSGRLNGVAMDAPIRAGQSYPFPSDPNQIYVASDTGGIWRTVDGGRNWIPETDFRGGQTTAIASVNRGINDTVYASEVLPSGVVLFLRSTNGGVTFTKTNPFPSGLFVEKLSVFVTDPLDQSRDGIYATLSLANPFASGQGVYRSTNGGATWNFISSSGFSATSVSYTDVAVHPTNPNFVYVATGNAAGDPNNGIYRTVNGLSANPTWTLLIGGSAFVPGSTPGNIKIAVSPVVPSVIFASLALRADPTSGAQPLLAVFRTLDSGINWTPTLVANPGNQQNDPRNYMGGTGADNNVIVVDPLSPNNPLQQRVYVAGFGGANNVMFSTTSTTNFGTLPPDPASLIGIGADGVGPYPNVHQGVIDTFGRLVIATGGGIYRNNSTGPVLWESLNGDIGPTGLTTNQFWGFALHPTNPDRAVGNIMSVPTNLQNAVLFNDPADPNNPNAAYGWSTIDAVGIDGNFGQGSVIYNPFNPNIVYRVVPGSSSRAPIRQSLDGGLTWAAASTGFQAKPTGGDYFGGGGIGINGSSYVPPLSIDPSRPNRLLSGYNRIFATDSDGANWQSRLVVNLAGGTIEIPELPTTQLTNNGDGLVQGPVPIDAVATGRKSNVAFLGFGAFNGAGIFAATPAFAVFDPDANQYIDAAFPGTTLFYAVIPEVNPGSWPPSGTTYDNHYWATITPPGVEGNITQIVVDPASEGTVYVYTNSGQVFRGTGLAVAYTVDDDNNIIPIVDITWVNLTGNLPRGSAPVSYPQPLALDKRAINQTLDRLYVGTINGVFRLDNPTQNFSGPPVWSEVGLASDGSRTLPAAPVSALALNPTTGILAAATYGRGVYELQIRGLVRGRIFDDTNGNGQLDAGEPLYVNVTVTAFNTTTNTSFSTITDSNGFYEFRSLTNGTYSITVEGTSGLFQTTQPTNALPITAQTTFDGANQLNIGLFTPGSISGFKYEDKNNNGIRDTDAAGVLEPGLAGFFIYIDRNGNGQFDPGEPNTVSASDGSYRFDASNVDNGSNLPRGVGPDVILGDPNNPVSGPHRIREIQQPPNFVQTSPDLNISITSGANFVGANIGNIRPARISGSKFEDINGDGIKQPNEGPLAGFLFDLIDPATGTVLQTVSSNAQGTFSFLSLPAGTYRVRERPQPGFTQTTANPPDIILGPTDNFTVAPFGNFRNVQISGFKFNDLNGNGVPNPNEPRLANFAFQLINSVTGQVIATTVSDANGDFSFPNLGPLPGGAKYRVREIVPSGWFQTTPNPPDITPVSGATPLVVFGNFRGVTVNGTVYLDVNGNGVRNPTEPGIPGFTIQLFKNGVLVGTGTSVSDGTYSIPLVGPGTYQLIQRPRKGFVATAPLNGYTFTTTSGSDLTGFDFGNQRRSITVTSNDAGGSPLVVIRDATTNAIKGQFNAYDPAFTGGVRTAVGFINNDSIPDIITGAGPGGGPHVRIFDSISGQELFGFMAYELSFTGGVYVATGDVDGDGFDEIITGTGQGGGPFVKVFKWTGTGVQLIKSFFAFDPQFRGGVTVATGDINGDGQADIATGAGPTGGPHVLVYNYANLAVLRSVFPYAMNFTGGVFVAMGDVNGDGFADLITGPGMGGGAHVKVYDGQLGTQLYSFLAFTGQPGFPWASGARVASYDVNLDGLADIIVSPGRGQPPRVRVFNGDNL